MKENFQNIVTKGLFITFEGISGSGKSENVESLRSYLAGKGYRVSVVEWNSNVLIRKIIYKINSINLLNSELYSLFQWFSFILDYFFKIRPGLKKNDILIADRYIYTGLTRDSANGASGRLGRAIYKRIIKPHLVFYQDVNPRECYKRILKRGKTLFHTNKVIKESSIIKNKDLFYLMKLRKEYILLLNNHGIKQDADIMWIRDNPEIVIKRAEEYISGKRGPQEYVKTFN